MRKNASQKNKSPPYQALPVNAGLGISVGITCLEARAMKSQHGLFKFE